MAMKAVIETGWATEAGMVVASSPLGGGCVAIVGVGCATGPVPIGSWCFPGGGGGGGVGQLCMNEPQSYRPNEQ